MQNLVIYIDESESDDYDSHARRRAYRDAKRGRQMERKQAREAKRARRQIEGAES